MDRSTKVSEDLDGQENFFQISDDEDEENEDVTNDELEKSQGVRGPYERAWTTEATRALIHIRGPMETRFMEGRLKRTTLWLHVTKQLQKLGFKYNAAKVQKKWHNILITYNKNLNKKFLSGYVHWEFFEEMFKYLQGKKADCERFGAVNSFDEGNSPLNNTEQLTTNQEIKTENTKTSDDYNDGSCSPDSKKLKYDFQSDNPIEMPLEILHENGSNDDDDVDDDDDAEDDEEDPDDRTDVQNSDWWKEYFQNKLQMDREKIELQKEMHRDMMNFNKMSLIQQEKVEKIKIEAINCLTTTLQKLIDNKSKKG